MNSSKEKKIKTGQYTKVLPLFLTGFTHCHACVVQRIYKNTDRLAFGMNLSVFFYKIYLFCTAVAGCYGFACVDFIADKFEEFKS